MIRILVIPYSFQDSHLDFSVNPILSPISIFWVSFRLNVMVSKSILKYRPSLTSTT